MYEKRWSQTWTIAFLFIGGVVNLLSMDLGTLDYYDSENEEFVYKEIGVVNFEYSLRAVYDWEAIWKKPFLNGSHSHEELTSFYQLMADRDIEIDAITHDVSEALAKYIGDSQTATKFTEVEGQNGYKGRSKVTTSEEIYALMAESHIPLEFENRNLNRLLTILRVLASRNSPKKKMSRDDILRQNASLNAQRKAMYNSKG